MNDLIEKLEKYGFECDAGSLSMCKDWIELKDALWPLGLSEPREVYAVYTNTDLTEGRGANIVKHFCKTEATAKRLAKGNYVQGSDCPIKPIMVFMRGHLWYGPVIVQDPTAADEKQQRALDAQNAAVRRAKNLGLSEDDIKLLRSA